METRVQRLRLIILAAALATSGCEIREANLRTFNDQRPTTAAERNAILTDVKKTFLDPYSIRDPEISYAAPSAMINGETVFNICVAANAKNSFGAYVGRKTTLFYVTPLDKFLAPIETHSHKCLRRPPTAVRALRRGDETRSLSFMTITRCAASGASPDTAHFPDRSPRKYRLILSLCVLGRR